MTFSLIAHVGAPGTSGGNTTSPIDTTGSNLLVMVVHSFNTNPPTVSDSKSNTWTLAISDTSAPGGLANSFIFIYYVASPTVGFGHTFTNNGNFSGLEVTAWSGASATPLDQTNHFGAQGVSAIQAGSITPTQNNALIIAGESNSNSYGPSSIDGGFTITDSTIGDSLSTIGEGAAYLIQTTAAAANPTWTLSGTPDKICAAIVSFLAGASGTAVTSDSPVLLEWLVSQQRDPNTPLEWVASQRSDNIAPQEWLSSQRPDRILPLEWRASQQSNPGLPLEWVGRLTFDRFMPAEWIAKQAAVDPILPVEWVLSVRGDGFAPAEWRSTAACNPNLPFEWTGLVRQTADANGSLEWLASAIVHEIAPGEWIGAVLRDGMGLAEWLAAQRSDVTLAGEWRASQRGDGGATAEWLGAIVALLIADGVLPIEWSALPAPMRVSLERLLVSPGKRRLLKRP